MVIINIKNPKYAHKDMMDHECLVCGGQGCAKCGGKKVESVYYQLYNCVDKSPHAISSDEACRLLHANYGVTKHASDIYIMLGQLSRWGFLLNSGNLWDVCGR